MELRQLEYFAAVARHGTFRRAAEEAFVTQSALSQQVGRLERELGLTLLHRRADGVALTPAGEELLAHAEPLLAGSARLRAAMDAHAGLRRGIARVAATAADTPWLADALVAFHQAHPDVQLALRHGAPGDVLGLLARGDVDLAICALRAADGQAEVLSDSPLVATLAPGHPLAGDGELDVGALRREPLILAQRGTALREAVVGACVAAGFSPVPRFEADDPATVRALVAAGLGVALVPAWWLRGTTGAVAVARLADAPRLRVGLLVSPAAGPAGVLLADHVRATAAS